ncbi:MAG: TVP38/TMEM64 family protein [Deltaproteobacteria bacterium]|nr:TVP38/TMEM64 family protein [Deltaproteobacteria bacterium]
MEANSKKDKNRSVSWRSFAIVALILCVIIALRYLGIGEKLGDLRQWIHEFGSLAPFVYVLIYIIAVVAALPGAAITIAGGALFGSVTGVILVSIGSTIGASLAFIIARYVARNAIVRRLSGNETFQKLDRMTEEHGAIIVAITRLVPIFPFNLLNYGFGLTKVPFGTYVFWSWLCMIPGTILYVVGTDAVVSGVSQGNVPWPLVAAMVAAGIVLFFLVKFARRRLHAKDDKKESL